MIRKIGIVFFANLFLLLRTLCLRRIKWNPICLVSPNASIKTIHRGKIQIGKKTCVSPNSEIMADGGTISLGDNVFINRNCVICSHANINIENNVSIGPNTCIYDHDHDGIGGFITERVLIKEGAWIGCNCTILKGVTIGEKSIIAAGSVVTKDVPSGEIWGDSSKQNKIKNLDIILGDVCYVS